MINKSTQIVLFAVAFMQPVGSPRTVSRRGLHRSGRFLDSLVLLSDARLHPDLTVMYESWVVPAPHLVGTAGLAFCPGALGWACYMESSIRSRVGEAIYRRRHVIDGPRASWQDEKMPQKRRRLALAPSETLPPIWDALSCRDLPSRRKERKPVERSVTVG